MGLTGDIYLTYITVDQTGNETANYQRNKNMKRRFLFLLFLVLIQRCPEAKKIKKSLKMSMKKKPTKLSPKAHFAGKLGVIKFVFNFLIAKLKKHTERTKNDVALEKSARMQAKMALRYEKALRKSVNMERKLMAKKAQRSVYPTMAKQVDFSLTSPAPYLQARLIDN